jgi:site-specific recombinase XerD
METIAAISGYYARGGEVDRLNVGRGRLEFLRTRDVLRRLLPARPALVLDVGGGAGVVVFLRSALMMLSFFSSQGWESWDIERRPLIPERMPVLIDDDLRLEDGPAAPRPATVVNRWLRELPSSGCPAPSSWESYARVVKGWAEFLAEYGVSLFDSRAQLKAALGAYAEHRATGPVKERFAATTWGQHMSVLSLFYRWAMAEGYAQAEPFTYRTARALFAGTGREVRVNLAVRRTPKPHVTIKYLEPDFTGLFLNGLRGLAPDGSQDTGFHGRELARNAAIGELALATGLQLQEFSYLLAYEIPALPRGPDRPSGAARRQRREAPGRRPGPRHLADPTVGYRDETGHFVRWSVQHRHVRGLTYGTVRWTGPLSTIDSEKRWADARRLLNDDTLPTPDRVAGLLLILYAQKVATISQLTVDDVRIEANTVSITFGTSPIVLPAPLAALVRELVATRRGKAKIGTPEDVPWLFPGGHPGRPLTDSQIGIRLHKIGIRPKQDRSTALFTLTTARCPHQSRRPVAAGIRWGLGRLRRRRQQPRPGTSMRKFRLEIAGYGASVGGG